MFFSFSVLFLHTLVASRKHVVNEKTAFNYGSNIMDNFNFVQDIP